jgi:hypothetical protein
MPKLDLGEIGMTLCTLWKMKKKKRKNINLGRKRNDRQRMRNREKKRELLFSGMFRCNKWGVLNSALPVFFKIWNLLKKFNRISHRSTFSFSIYSQIDLVSICYTRHCFFCRPSDFFVPEDAGIKPRTVATFLLAVRRSNHSATPHPPLN